MKKTISVTIVDDSRLFRDGLISVLREIPKIKVISTAENGKVLLELLEVSNPDIVLLDIEMPVLDGEKALEIISVRFPHIKTIIISMYFDGTLIEALKEKGAWGFIPKGCNDKMIEETIFSVYEGVKTFNTETASGLVLKQKTKSKRAFENKDNLSEREIEIINLICLCKSNKQIANILFITERTVEFHKTNIYKKTKCVSSPDLVLYSIKNGLMVL
jgi:DNA-binding NarL/FixJ family response regulator